MHTTISKLFIPLFGLYSLQHSQQIKQDFKEKHYNKFFIKNNHRSSQLKTHLNKCLLNEANHLDPLTNNTSRPSYNDASNANHNRLFQRSYLDSDNSPNDVDEINNLLRTPSQLNDNQNELSSFSEQNAFSNTGSNFYNSYNDIDNQFENQDNSFEKYTLGDDQHLQQKSEYDFIVVGSGASGSLVAVRLANKGYKTLLIEAGPNYTNGNLTAPAFHLNADLDPEISWAFDTKNFPESSGLRQNVFYPRASVLGGCTLHNALIHVYPNKEDFEYLVKITGDKSWSESNMRKYFYEFSGSKRTIRNSFPLRILSQVPLFSRLQNFFTNAIASITRNKGWLPLTVFEARNVLSFDTKLADIMYRIIFKPMASRLITGLDINDKIGDQLVNSQEGPFLIPMNVLPGEYVRKGVRELMLETVKNNKNLTIWTDTLVTKIILSKDNSKAIGVTYKKGKHFYRASPLSINTDNIWDKTKYESVYAKREIIISAGTYNTPQLMMLSGIGDEKELLEKGIKPKVHLPGIGKNMQDRYEISLNYRFSENFTVLEACEFKIGDSCYQEYVNYATGGYTFNGLISGDLSKSNPNLSQSDIFTLIGPIYFTGYKRDSVENLRKYKNMFTYYILKAHTKNTAGVVKLQTNDPRDKPYINFNYFSQNANSDLDPIVDAIRRYRKQAASFPHQLIEVNPGKERQTDDQLKEYIRRTAWGHHACCTMKIGTDNDNLAVLDGNFKVRKIQNLRVVDMSVFNKIPGYFPVLFLYMIGAKASDVIAYDHPLN